MFKILTLGGYRFCGGEAITRVILAGCHGKEITCIPSRFEFGTYLRIGGLSHVMRKASTIWATITGLDRNPADQVEVEHMDDARKRYLSEEELRRLKVALDERMYRKGTRDINKTNLRLRLLVLIAVATGMRRG